MAKEEHSEQIRQLAYEIWEREGRPEGKESEHWKQAERELRERMAQDGAGREQEPPAGNEKRSRWPGAAPTAASKPKRTTTTRKKRSTEK